MKKVALIIAIAALSMTIFAVPAFAEQHFYFDFEKGQVHEAMYATKWTPYDARVYPHSDGDVYFVQGSSKMGSRVCTLDGTKGSDFRVISWLDQNYYYPYSNPNASAGWLTGFAMRLQANVQADSGTQWIRVWGYYEP